MSQAKADEEGRSGIRWEWGRGGDGRLAGGHVGPHKVSEKEGQVDQVGWGGGDKDRKARKVLRGDAHGCRCSNLIDAVPPSPPSLASTPLQLQS